MTALIDAAIQAGCNVGRSPNNDPCKWPACQCPEDKAVALAVLRAAIPKEPPIAAPIYRELWPDTD